MTAATLTACPQGRRCLMHSIDLSGSSFSDTPSLRACFGIVSLACGGSPADGAQRPDQPEMGSMGRIRHLPQCCAGHCS